MVNYIWLKISAAVTVLCGIYTSYKVSQYIKLKQMKIVKNEEIEKYKTKYVMAEGIVVASGQKDIVSSIEKITEFGTHGTRLRTNYVKHIAPFNLKNMNQEFIINLNEVKKIRCEPSETKHELLVYTFSQCLEIFINQIITMFTGVKYEIARSQKTKSMSIRSGSSAVVYGQLSSVSPACINAEIIGTSKEAILDTYFKSLTTPTVLLSICSSITMIIGFVYISNKPPADPPSEPVPENLECIICLSRKKNIILWPCKHVCICDTCLKNDITKCPLCRTRVAHQYKINY